jgi:hypothetical protein
MRDLERTEATLGILSSCRVRRELKFRFGRFPAVIPPSVGSNAHGLGRTGEISRGPQCFLRPVSKAGILHLYARRAGRLRRLLRGSVLEQHNSGHLEKTQARAAE